MSPRNCPDRINKRDGGRADGDGNNGVSILEQKRLLRQRGEHAKSPADKDALQSLPNDYKVTTADRCHGSFLDRKLMIAERSNRAVGIGVAQLEDSDSESSDAHIGQHLVGTQRGTLASVNRDSLSDYKVIMSQRSMRARSRRRKRNIGKGEAQLENSDCQSTDSHFGRSLFDTQRRTLASVNRDSLREYKVTMSRRSLRAHSRRRNRNIGIGAAQLEGSDIQSTDSRFGERLVETQRGTVNSLRDYKVAMSQRSMRARSGAVVAARKRGSLRDNKIAMAQKRSGLLLRGAIAAVNRESLRGRKMPIAQRRCNIHSRAAIGALKRHHVWDSTICRADRSDKDLQEEAKDEEAEAEEGHSQRRTILEENRTAQLASFCGDHHVPSAQGSGEALRHREEDMTGPDSQSSVLGDSTEVGPVPADVTQTRYLDATSVIAQDSGGSHRSENPSDSTAPHQEGGSKSGDDDDAWEECVEIVDAELVDPEAEDRSLQAEVDRRATFLLATQSVSTLLNIPEAFSVELVTPEQNEETFRCCGAKRRKAWRNWLGLVILCLVAIVVSVTTGLLFGSNSKRRSKQDSAFRAAHDTQATSSFSTNMSSSNSTLHTVIERRVAFKTTQELYNAVDIYLETNSSSISTVAGTYGHPIGSWDVSSISDFTGLFDVERNPLSEFFNEDLSLWNMSRALKTDNMFRGATSFDQDLSGWNVSNVRSMVRMFNWASSLKANLSSWDVSAATDLRWLFTCAQSFSSDLSNWNVSQVRTMRSVFSCALSFNSNLAAWDVSRVTDMRWMFFQAHNFSGDLSTWNTMSVRSMRNMFNEALSLNTSLSAWDVSRVTDMFLMFDKVTGYVGDLSGWDVSSVKDMGFMFANTIGVTDWGDLSSWNVSRVTNMRGMFYESDFHGNVSSWDVSRLRIMTSLFERASNFNDDLSLWNVSSCEDMRGMFQSASSFNQNLCAWGPRLAQSVLVNNEFWQSDCPTKSDPVLSASPPGPFCHPC